MPKSYPIFDSCGASAKSDKSIILQRRVRYVC